MSPVDEILSQIPMSQLAGRLGVDERTAEAATRQALPALLGGIQANTDDPGGASSFANAVQQHDAGLAAGGVDLAQVDTADGDKIVGHVFGANRGQVVQQLGSTGALGGKVGQDLIAQLLPILAPIVMSWLASKLTGGAAPAPTPAPAPQAPAGGGGIGDLLGGILGGVLAGGGSGGAPNIGDLLGGLLGGGRK
ncbi:hypothetical protein GCM10017691_46910 [Pseudonocardia petroleophila]|uniref:DUF937 domain-containing protein n=1 Tax=Pseudonocardia petroleophila TaxID=37331 RepID=A0A7G7MQP8_9PSEU|nr:DUF937 domain-containing protein [Pseudonocardia petroleophila]QNG55109.1 DUF937 domain-containing protein [Pseudonocardia petroleophila]